MKIANIYESTLLLLIVLAIPSMAMGAAAEDENQPSDGTRAETAPAGETAQGEVTVLVGEVSESAGRLQGAVERFSKAMEAAGTQDSGMQALDEMLDAARSVKDSLNKDSEIWQELEGLITTWSAKRDSAIERARNNQGLQPLAERWQEKIARAVDLRTAILDQAADAEILVEDIENKKEVIAEYYELDAIDQVLAEMQVMSDELTTMNASMQEILNKTVGVQENRESVAN